MAKIANTTTSRPLSVTGSVGRPIPPAQRGHMLRLVGARYPDVPLIGHPTAARAPAGRNPDRVLLQLCRRFMRLVAEMCALYDIDTPEAQERANQLGRYLYDGTNGAEGLVWTICALPAKTPQGRRARVEILWDGCHDLFEDQDDWDAALVAAVLRDARSEALA